MAISDSRAASQFLFQALHGFLDVFLAFARAAGHPVGVAQLVKHRAANALGGKGLELHALGHFVAGERVGQPDHSDLDQVVQLHIRRQLGDHVVREATNQRNILANHRITIKLALGCVCHFNGSEQYARECLLPRRMVAQLLCLAH